MSPWIVCVLLVFFLLMIRRPPRSTRTDTLFPYTTLFRSDDNLIVGTVHETSNGFTSVLVGERGDPGRVAGTAVDRSEEHTSELQSLMRISYAVFCLKKHNNSHTNK